jgi:hypothetical protein
MNDFTKEDLKLLLNWRDNIKYTKKPNPQVIASNELLSDKIQSMIENYCEHDSKQYYDDIPVDVCNNCHMVIL